MKANEGLLDRVIRVVLGIGAWLAAAAIGMSPWGIVLAVVGLILVVTGAVGFCPLYRLVGIKTTKAGANAADEDSGKKDAGQGRHAA